MMRLQPVQLSVTQIKEYDFSRGFSSNSKKDRLVFAQFGTVQHLTGCARDNLLKIGCYATSMGWRCDVYIWGDHLLLTGYDCPQGLNIRKLDRKTCEKIDSKFRK